MNKKLTRTLAGVMSLMFMGQVMVFGDGSAQGLLHADTIASATELFATPVTEQNEIVYANDLTIYGYVQKGTVNGFEARDNEPVYVRIFNGDWAEIAYTEVNSDGSYSVTASGSKCIMSNMNVMVIFHSTLKTSEREVIRWVPVILTIL